jgi:uncharacterized protein
VITRNLLLSGGPGHDFRATSALLAAALAEQGIESTVVDDPGSAFGRLRAAEAGREPALSLVTVHALHWRMDQPRYAHLRERMAWSPAPGDMAALDRFVRGGGGLLALHTAVICFDADPVWRELCGAAWDWSASSHPPVGPVPITVTHAGHHHSITADVDNFDVEDEVYRDLDTAADVVPLLCASHDGRAHPVLWAREVGSGRVVTDLLGHGVESQQHATHRQVLARAAAWALGDQVGSATEACGG